MTDDGKFITKDDFKENLYIYVDDLNYCKLISAIPNQWKRYIKNLRNSRIEIIKESKIRVAKKIMPLTKVNNTMLYWAILNKKTQEPTAVEKWVEQFPFLELAPWNKLFNLIHYSAKEPYLQSFQYKIINRILNCNYNLYMWKIKNNPQGIYCRSLDTIEHHPFFCPPSKTFWEIIKKIDK